MNRDPNKLEILPISSNSELEKVNKDALNDVYTSLYNSLGVEPGLLSKTKIGRDINKKFRDDSIDAKIYAKVRINDILEQANDVAQKIEEPAIIDTYSPFIVSNNASQSELTITKNSYDDTVSYSLSAYIEEYMYRSKVTNEELLKELNSFIENRFGYTIKKKEGN